MVNELSNYLLQLANVEGKEICLVGIGGVVKSLYKDIKQNYSNSVLKLFRKEFGLSDRSLCHWINNSRSIPISKLQKLVDLWARICNKSEIEKHRIFDEIFKTANEASISGGNKMKLPKKLTKNLAYLIGYICGDGCLVNPYPSFKKRKRMNCAISIYEESGEHLKEVIRPLFSKIFNFNIKVVHSTNENSYNITFNSKILHTFLVRVLGLPFGSKAGKLHIPHLVKSSKQDIQINFLQGMFDSDGSIYEYRDGNKKKPKISIRQASKGILDEIKQILTNLGIKSNGPYWDRSATTWLLEIKNMKSLIRFKSIINFRHRWKRERIDKIVNSPVV